MNDTIVSAMQCSGIKAKSAPARRDELVDGGQHVCMNASVIEAQLMCTETVHVENATSSVFQCALGSHVQTASA